MRLMTPAINNWSARTSGICVRGDGVPRRQWLCRGLAAGAALSRGTRSTRSGRVRAHHVPGCPAGCGAIRGAGTGARSCPLASSAEQALLQPLIEADSVSLRRDIERLVHLVAASLLARHARASWSMPMCGPGLRSGARRRYSLERSEIDAAHRSGDARREVSEAVEHALQDPGGSQLVDQLAAGAARVAVDQHPLDGHRRQPFVPKSK